MLDPKTVAQQRGDAVNLLRFFGRGCLRLLCRLALIGLFGLRFCSHDMASWDAEGTLSPSP